MFCYQPSFGKCFFSIRSSDIVYRHVNLFCHVEPIIKQRKLLPLKEPDICLMGDSASSPYTVSSRTETGLGFSVATTENSANAPSSLNLGANFWNNNIAKLVNHYKSNWYSPVNTKKKERRSKSSTFCTKPLTSCLAFVSARCSGMATSVSVPESDPIIPSGPIEITSSS